MAKKTSLYLRFGKRAFDIIGILLVILFNIPQFCIVAVCVALTSKGPIFFTQERIGKNFSRFKLIKFRTMVVDAQAKGPLVTRDNDPRITKIGAFLRKTKLDELPQLFNVLKGDMSIVGPRPEVEKYTALFKDKYESILSIRPGITDYATIEYRDEEKTLSTYSDTEDGYIKEVLPAKIALYEKYLREMSFATDWKIIFMTVKRLFS